MSITTKFNIGDKIFFISDAKKVCQSEVMGYRIEKCLPKQPNQTITYLCASDKDSMVHVKVDETEGFKSKEELLKSL